jgi:hypothetical protein
LGGAWYAPPAVSQETWTDFDQKKLSYLRNSIDLLKSPEQPWFIKDPRLSLLMPIWDRLSLQLLPAIFVIRNPTSVAQSLHLRNGFSHRKGLALWWAYNAAIVAELGTREFLVIDYDTSVKQKMDAVAGIFAFSSYILANASVAGKKPLTLEQTWLDQDQLDLAIRQKQASKGIMRELARNKVAKRLPGVAAEQLQETLDVYETIKQEHGYQNSTIKKLDMPDWVFEELHASRIDYKNRLIIDNLTDQIALANIEIKTLKESDPVVDKSVKEQVNSLQEQIYMLEIEKDELSTQIQALNIDLTQKNEELIAANLIIDAQVDTLSRLEHKLFQFEVERTSAQSQALALHEELEEVRRRLDVTLAEQNSKSEEVGNLKESLKLTESNLAAANDSLSTLRLEITETKHQLAEISDESNRKSNQIIKLRKDLTTLNDTHDSLQMIKSTKENELRRSRAALTAITNELVHLTIDLNTARIESTRLNDFISTKSVALDQTIAQINHLEREFLIAIYNSRNYLNQLDSIRASRAFKLASRIWRMRFR